MIGRWQERVWLRRLAFIGANIAVVVLITGLFVLPVRTFFDARDAQIIEQRETLARLQAIVAQESVVRAMANQPVGQGEFLAGKNEGVINADLQTRLKGMVEAAGARLRSVRALQSQPDEHDRHIGSRIELSGNLQAIHRVIHAIESAKPYLFVGGAAIRPAPPTGPKDLPQEPTLEAQFDVFGIVRADGRER
jgi:general secretion pathway protein M